MTERETEAERKIPEERSEGKHLTSSCGSESGKGERKHTARLSTKNREGMHGKPGRKERGRRKKGNRKTSTEEATARRRQEARERKKQRLSSQNPKLKRTKECENSGGQKAERKRRKPWNGWPREVRNESRRQG